MIVYHGTTATRAQRICEMGFLPRKPSRRVWFAESRAYALHRAKTQARRARDRPVILTCDLDVARLRERLGPKRVLHRNRVIAVDGPLPVSVLRSNPFAGVPTSPAELARWVNDLLGLKPHKGASRTHPGIDRLSRWVNHRLATDPRSRLRPSELLAMARRWLHEFFEGYEVDPAHLTAYRRVGTVDLQVDASQIQPSVQEDEAAECLDDPSPKRRVRGLRLLAEMGDPDLFDWCVLLLDDEALSVRLAALETMLRCEEAHAQPLVPLARSENKRVRAAAIAALAKHGGEDAPRWFERGLKDPSPCVRVAAARLLPGLDPAEHRPVFELALADPNPEVARIARKLTVGKGYAVLA